MKLFFLLLAFGTLISCNNNGESKQRKNDFPFDTTVILYQDNQHKLFTDWALRKVIDTFMMVDVDASTSKKKWVIDTIYFVSRLMPDLDSLGKQKKDSLGKPKLKETGIRADKSVIIKDYNYSPSGKIY